LKPLQPMRHWRLPGTWQLRWWLLSQGANIEVLSPEIL